MEVVDQRFQERLPIDGYNQNIYHVTRYKFAKVYVRGKFVLDIACGSGYGSTLLIESRPKEVIGLDLDHEAIKVAQQSKDNRSKSPLYLVGSAERIPIPDLTVDVVVCIETIEHINGDKRAVNEFQRVLKPGGILLLTTPNAKITRPMKGVPNNPYHIREYTLKDLITLLSSQFTDINFFGQRVRGTIIGPKNPPRNNLTVLVRRLLDIFPLEWRREYPKVLPNPIADWIVRRITKHNYYLREDDIEFGDWGVDHSPVLVAVCKKN